MHFQFQVCIFSPYLSSFLIYILLLSLSLSLSSPSPLHQVKERYDSVAKMYKQLLTHDQLATQSITEGTPLQNVNFLSHDFVAPLIQVVRYSRGLQRLDSCHWRPIRSRIKTTVPLRLTSAQTSAPSLGWM